MVKHNILLVDDDNDILEFLEYNFKKNDFNVHACSGSSEALSYVQKNIPDVVILDVMMPGMDGIELCERMREKFNGKSVIIIMLTARGEDYSHIAGLEAGADDYIVKPINPKVLITKVKAMLRRQSNYQKNGNGKMRSGETKNGDFVIDREKYVIYENGNNHLLPRKEFELMALLVSKPGKVFTREEIYDKIWGSTFVGERTIDVHIRKLRERFGDRYIKTVKGVGYKFVEGSSE